MNYFQRKEYSVLLYIVTVVACLNLLWLAYTIGYIKGRDEASGGGYLDYDILFLQIRVGIAFLVVALGLKLMSAKGYSLSFVALIWVLLEYFLWYLKTKKWLSSFNVSTTKDLPPIVLETVPHVGGFYKGTIWTWVILVITSLLTLWVGKILLQSWYLKPEKQ